MENHQFVQLIRKELPGLLRRDRALREWVLELTRTQYADKGETESRFDQVLEQLRQNQEAQDRKWTEYLEAQDRKWEENQRLLRRMQESIEAQAKKHDSSIGALGARWGLYSEQAFRRGLEGILSASFGVEVRNITEYDEGGDVFGHPDQVELDVVIQDGTLLLVEIKSSMSKADMYIFERKVAFYEQRHGRPVARKLVISPMVEEGARQVAERLMIEVYSHAEEASLEG